MAALKKPFPGSQIVVSLGLIIVSAVYAVWQNTAKEQFTVIHNSKSTITPGQSYKEVNDALLKTLAEISASTPSTTPLSAPAPVAPSGSPMTPQPTMGGPMMMHSGLYADGSYTGNAEDAYYGIVQIQALIQNGRIADVQFLQYPSDRSTSRYINGQAMPLLTQEAIQAQSAQVNGVSGATFTSQAFKQSLASALVKAKN